jgi:threonine dehydrogenase-like Zn-dependent dehydrogenase
VLGPGPVGLITAMVANATGADRVVVVGRSSSRNRFDTAACLGSGGFLILGRGRVESGRLTRVSTAIYAEAGM